MKMKETHFTPFLSSEQSERSKKRIIERQTWNRETNTNLKKKGKQRSKEQ